MIIGAIILDLSKRFMFYFHYRQTKANMNLELLYSDTDSFICAIKTDDVFADLQKMNDGFDFSNYPNDNFLFSKVNKKVVLKFKDKAAKKNHWRILSRFTCWNMQVSIEKKAPPRFSWEFFGFLMSSTETKIRF